jgi:cell surface protein SprA
LNRKTTHIFRTLVATTVLLAIMLQAHARFFPHPSPQKFFVGFLNSDTTRYPLYDRYGDPYSYPNRNPFYLQDTSFIKKNIIYDPQTKQYYVEEKIGNQYYRTPVSFSMKEFLEMQGKLDEQEYFRKRANLLANMNRRNYKPKFQFFNNWVNRITGNGKIDIRPTGYVDILAGYQGQNSKNPTLPERARKNGGFDFNMNSQLQVDANIGDKLKLPINYNTLANFDYENQLKLDYHGQDDEILKLFQAGNINFSTKGTLIPGAQSLFGIKTELQFGKLFITTVLANQRSTRQSLGLQGGSATQRFSIKADEYEENRHFLLAQYFRNHYNEAMKNLPIVNSAVQIQRIEVWVTNRTGATTDTRDIVALADLGEGGGNALPDNGANSLYSSVLQNPAARNSTQVTSALTAMGLQPVQDFEKTFARKLQPTDYYFNPQIGFISLNQQLQPDEVLAVAFQYTYNGRVRQVGEFSQDIPPDSTGNSQKVLFLKLLKATSQRPALPIWDLMMKNVYSVGYGQLDRKDFQLDILYEEPSLGEKRYLPPDSGVLAPYKGQPILSLVNLDRLNDQNDPQPNGFFDYIEGFTVISSQSRIIFPVLEPFGHDLDYVYDPPYRDKYLYYPLYDTIKAIAQTYANLNRFKIEGRSTSGSNSDYQLGFNIPKGSVTVTAGGQILKENIDYEINYDLGTLKIINPSIISTGLPVQVQYENNATFGLQQKNYIGIRLDYLVNRHLTLGGTMVRLGERPFFTKTSYGDDPIKNSMIGADFDYRNDIPRLSKWLDKLPFYSTRSMSSITAYGEVAALIPGHPKQIGKGRNGQSYIDDFEGTRSSIDLRFPLINWTLASVPQNAVDQNGNILFPEASLNNDLASGFNRAKIAWYNIEPVLQERSNPNNPLAKNLAELSKPESRLVLQQEIFPEKTTNLGQGVLTTFDLAYYPRERGPYNFRTDVNSSNGELLEPKKAFGGIMRNIDQTDFETSNIEYIEFWMQNPFINKPGSSGGQLYFNLGNISEDILKDGKRQYENGLPTPHNQPRLDTSTVWGQVPSNPLQVTNAFSNDPADRPYQDVGYDGLTDTAEQRKFSAYLSTLAATYGANSAIYKNAYQDPSHDDFKNYRDGSYGGNDGILARYKDFNNPQGNSPVADNNSQFTNAFTLYPDQEDLNRDNTMSEAEEYFQYRVDLKPGMGPGNNPFITDERDADIHLPDGSTRREQWYLFRIPIQSYQDKIGNIPDFKSIRFIRMFLTNFDDTVVCRFGKLELVRNQWRKFNFNIDTTGLYTTLPANDPVATNILAVNLEENDSREPIPYRIPPGIERQQELSNNNVQLLLNEQSLSLKVCGLSKDIPTNKARGVFKTMNLDLRQYGRMSMFIHIEDAYAGNNFGDGDVNAVIRIGNDFAGNYYEVKIPLKVTQWHETDSLKIWPAENNLDFDLQDLVKLKVERNKNGASPSKYYQKVLSSGRIYAILGNPNLGEVRGIMMGLEDVGQETVCAEAWFNELRLSRLDEKGGYAAIGRVDVNLADLGNLSLAGSVKSTGFGTLEQRVNERSREDDYQFDVATNLDFGKLLPKKAAIQIPVYAGINRTSSTPEYDPYDQDIKLKEKLKESVGKDRDSIRNNAEDITTTKTFTLTNVKKNRTGTGKPKLWDVSNLDFNYSYISMNHHNPLIENEELRRTRGAIGYTYSPQARPVEPFKRIIKSKSKWLGLIRDFNFNYAPSSISVKADVFRQFGAIRPRNVGGGPYKIPETYNKYFLFDRYYIVNWDLTRSIRIDYTAVNNARVDEPSGRIDTKAKKDSIRNNFFKGGRTTHFGQDITASYVLPTQKLPLLDWTTIRASYTASYDWDAASLLARNLGNTLINGQTRNVNGEFSFDQLYNKSKFLRLINNEGPVQKSNEPKRLQVKVKPSDTASQKMKWIRNPKWQPAPGKATRFFGRMLLSLKRIGVQLNEDMGTTLPGYLDSTQFFGRNFRSSEPGWGYIFGLQPDTNRINAYGAKGLLTHDTLFNSLIQQRYNQRINVTGQLSPIRDLNIDITLEKTFNKQYSELYKDTSAVDNVGLTRLNPYALGSFNITYISYQTLFKKFDPNTVSETFKQFEANRLILSQRLSAKNPYSSGGPVDPTDPKYVYGYGRYAQDVVIPAFLAAYTDKDPMSITLIKNSNANLRSNPFARLIPRPNWNVTYSGLSKIKGLDKLFTNFTIRHGYQSNLSMNSFNTALRFEDPFHYGYPEFIDTTTHSYIPFFLVPNVTISEQFNPLIGIDVSFANQLSANFEYKKSRTLSLSLIDYQLAENRSTEVTVGINWRKRGVPIIRNIKIGKNGMKLDNDVTFKFDFSLRDDATANSKLDQNTAFGTAGQKVIRISPSIDYVLNSRVNVKLYFEQNRVIPKIATTAPVTNTRGGVQIRISLAQ